MKFYNKIAFWLTSVWAIIEAILCIVVLSTYKEQDSHAENFLYGLCEGNACGHFILKALIGRIIALILLFAGNLMVSLFYTLMNVLNSKMKIFQSFVQCAGMDLVDDTLVSGKCNRHISTLTHHCVFLLLM